MIEFKIIVFLFTKINFNYDIINYKNNIHMIKLQKGGRTNRNG